MDIVERMTKAYYVALYGPSDIVPAAQEVDAMRAAIAVMREPGKDLIRAGALRLDGGGGDYNCMAAQMVWRGVIDEALK